VQTHPGCKIQYVHKEGAYYGAFSAMSQIVKKRKGVYMEKLILNTTEQTVMVDITDEIQKIVSKSSLESGICYIFVPHTTAGITINENADPDVRLDIIMELNKIIPFRDSYRHMEGNSAAHIKASLIGESKTVIIENSRLQLGTWQGIFFCEFDGPRRRQVWIRIIPL
jgi:secondary thiamine-phosphate synthase enzyme